MKKLITISLAIIITVAFCFVSVPQNKAKAEMPNLDSTKTAVQNFLSSYKGGAKPSAKAQHITADDTWSGTHHVTDDVDVDGTLTIEPGTQVIFDGDYGIFVAGSLVANGTAASPITLTSATNYTGIDSEDGGSITLNHCNIDYAGSATSSDIGITVGGPCSISNCNFTHGSSGVNSSNIFIGAGSNITIANNDFDNSTQAGILNGVSGVTVSNNHFENKSIGIWSIGNVTISGNQFNLGEGSETAIGVLDGQATIDGNIIGADAIVGIFLGAFPFFVGTNEHLSQEGINATITHNDISGVEVGIGILNEVVATINFNNIHNNSAIGVAVQNIEQEGALGDGSLPDATIKYNDITGNGLYGVAVGGLIVRVANGQAVNATKNYWGSNTGPTHSSNPGGTGDAVTDNVDFVPWLDLSYTTPPPINSVNLIEGQTVGGIYPINVDASWVVHGLPLDDFTKVDFYIDGVLIGTDTTAPYSYDWDTTVHASPHIVRIVATNVLGTTNEKTVNVNVENALPYTGK